MNLRLFRNAAHRVGACTAIGAACVLASGVAWADSFSEVIPWNGAAIHQALMPDGNVVTFGSTPDGAQGGYQMTVWNPRQGSGVASRVIVPNSLNFNSFCTSVTLNPADGNMLISGSGTDAANVATHVAEWNYGTKLLTNSFELHYPRYYGTSTVLPDGRIHMVGGSLYHGNQTNASPISEIFTQGKGWVTLPGTANGPQRQGDTQLTGSPNWYPHVFPVRGTEVFIVAGKFRYFENYAGAGSIRNQQPFNGSNFGASSAAVMFRPGLVMQVGGGSAFNNTSNQLGSNVASIFDLRGVDAQGKSTVTQRDTFMTNGRHWATPTVLANGEVLVTGGALGDNALNGVAYQSEIFNPVTNTWRLGAAMSVPRLYHSTAMLLKDGRVLVAGGGVPGPVFGNNAQIYTPDYLANAGGLRPSILTAPNRVALGQVFRLTADRVISRMTLVKVGAVTHNYHSNQRFFETVFKPVVGGYDVTFPNDAVNATPGLYMLFAFDARGVPSEGKFVRLPSPTGDNNWNVPNDLPTSKVVPMDDSNVATRWEACAVEGGVCNVPSTRRVRYGANNTYAIREVAGTTACNIAAFGWDPAVGANKACAYEVPLLQVNNQIGLEPGNAGNVLQGYKARHLNFVGYISPINSASPDLDWSDSQWLVRSGLADTACYSFEAVSQPGRYLRHYAMGLRLDAPDGTAVYPADATWCPRNPLNGRPAGGAVSFESKNYPGYFMRHQNFDLKLSLMDGTQQVREDGTFLPVNAKKLAASNNIVSFESILQPSYRIRHFQYSGYLNLINQTSNVLDQNDSAWIVHPGLADPTCQSFEAVDQPGYYMRHINFQIKLNQPDGGPTFKPDATFCPRLPLNGRTGGQAVSLQPIAYPGYYLYHRNYVLYIGPDDGWPSYKDDATFLVNKP